MTAKEYLSQYKHLNVEIYLKQEQVKKLRETAESVSHMLMSVDGNTPHSDKIGHTIAKLADTENEILSLIDSLLTVEKKIERVIESVENLKLRQLLILRYIDDKKWKEIADIMHINDLKWIYKLHRKALQEINLCEIRPLESDHKFMI